MSDRSDEIWVFSAHSATSARALPIRQKVLIFTDIGKKYYKNPDGDNSELRVLCEDIDQRRRRIKKMRYELNGIRGYKICPKCDAEVNERFQFCGRCGARLPDIEDEDFMSLEPNDYYTESSNNFFNADSNKNY